ncbi:MAG: DNA repair protein RadC [Candidatus Gracilibacteria bacterium]|jgi:DNA repair protein RadC
MCDFTQNKNDQFNKNPNGGSKKQILLKNSDQAFAILKDMKNLKKEYLRGLFINSRYFLIHDEVISMGTLNTNIVHPREIFRPAIEHNAYAIILAHNHPSGECTPSQKDLEMTAKIDEAGKILQIPVLDHLIIAENGYFSFHKAGLMP